MNTNYVLTLKDDFSHLTTPWGEFVTSCLVRQVSSPAPFTRGMDEVVYTEPDDNTQPVPYMPREFPIGTWDIEGVEDKEPNGDSLGPYEFPFFVRTNAWRFTERWKVVQKDKLYYVSATTEMHRDSGYGFHTSTSPTTLGCCRVGTALVPGEAESIRKEKLEEGLSLIRKLVDNLRGAWEDKDTVQVEVLP